MAKSEKPAKPAKAAKQSRRKQIAASYRMTKQADPRIGLILLLTFLVAGGIAFLLTSCCSAAGCSPRSTASSSACWPR
jgi:hypothetical protein